MMQAHFIILVLLLQSPVPYRLLTARESGSEQTLKEIDYSVSVDQYLDGSQARNIVCALIREKKPRSYDVLSIGIYYKLDGDAADMSELRERRLVQYHWSKDSPNDARRLVLTKDAKGQSLPEWRFYNFDHTKSCR
jgi:hypothetical protein